MRIISGKFRGKKLIPPKNDDIRPTTDRAKESLFNMIQNYVYESNFLDLFSGSGAIAIEALSRGAKHITLVEKSKTSLKTINSNLNILNCEKSNISLKNQDVLEFLENTNTSYDIIFADPPYDYEDINKVIEIISRRKILSQDGILILETDKSFDLKLDDMYVEKEKIYAISKLSIIRNKEV